MKTIRKSTTVRNAEMPPGIAISLGIDGPISLKSIGMKTVIAKMAKKTEVTNLLIRVLNLALLTSCLMSLLPL